MGDIRVITPISWKGESLITGWLQGLTLVSVMAKKFRWRLAILQLISECMGGLFRSLAFHDSRFMAITWVLSDYSIITMVLAWGYLAATVNCCWIVLSINWRSCASSSESPLSWFITKKFAFAISSAEAKESPSKSLRTWKALFLAMIAWDFCLWGEKLFWTLVFFLARLPILLITYRV